MEIVSSQRKARCDCSQRYCLAHQRGERFMLSPIAKRSVSRVASMAYIQQSSDDPWSFIGVIGSRTSAWKPSGTVSEEALLLQDASMAIAMKSKMVRIERFFSRGKVYCEKEYFAFISLHKINKRLFFAKSKKSRLLILHFSILFLDIFREVSEMHVTFAAESVVHSECSREVMMNMSTSSNLQILTEEWAVVRMRTILDNLVGTHERPFASKVGNTLFCYDYVDVVLRVVVV